MKTVLTITLALFTTLLAGHVWAAPQGQSRVERLKAKICNGQAMKARFNEMKTLKRQVLKAWATPGHFESNGNALTEPSQPSWNADYATFLALAIKSTAACPERTYKVCKACGESTSLELSAFTFPFLQLEVATGVSGLFDVTKDKEFN